MSLSWDDPRLIQHIQNWFIEYPDPGAPYFFSTDEPDLEGQVKQATIVDELLGYKTNSFFVHLEDKYPVVEKFMLDKGYRLVQLVEGLDLVFIKDSY